MSASETFSVSEHDKALIAEYESTREQRKNLVDAYVATFPQPSTSDAAGVILGSADHAYRMVSDWAKLPDGWVFVDVPAVAVDKDDNVYAFNRSDHPVMVFDRDGNFLRSWGEGMFKCAHGIFIGPDGMVYLADDGDHCVRKCTPEGKVLLTLGTPGKPAPYMSGDPFCRCTDVALSPKGEIYVSDGYFNGRVHKYAPDGKLLFSWGGPGVQAGEFNVAHNIVCDKDGWVYVADRENHRVQVFDGNGKYETQWNNLHRANSLTQARGVNDRFYLGEAGPLGRHMPNAGPSVVILNPKGERLATLATLSGETKGQAPDRFVSCHGLAVDSRGDIYVGDNVYRAWRTKNKDRTTIPRHLRALRKLVKV